MYRVVWQCGRELVGGPGDLPPSPQEIVERFIPLMEGMTLVEPVAAVFRPHPAALRSELLEAPEQVREDPDQDLAGYCHAFVATRDDAELLRQRLWNVEGVRFVEIESAPREPVVERAAGDVEDEPEEVPLGLPLDATPAFHSFQGYLRAGEGVGARAAWRVRGGTGERVHVVDVEVGWNFEHEDLRHRSSGTIFGPRRLRDHGTAALGVLSADPNRLGVLGVAHGAYAAGASVRTQRGGWNVAGAILAAARRLGPGHVILVEMETFHGLPAEHNRAERAAIRDAVRRGIVVVEAAGNARQDLDDPRFAGRFSRRHDSGAILVGAGASPLHAQPARSRLPFSNHGSRLDLQAWGDHVVTCGGNSQARWSDLHRHPIRERCYTRSFDGTSSAAAIVAGAAACVLGALRAAERPPMDGPHLRRLLVETGQRQNPGRRAPVSQRIGPLPDLRQAIETLALGG